MAYLLLSSYLLSHLIYLLYLSICLIFPSLLSPFSVSPLISLSPFFHFTLPLLSSFCLSLLSSLSPSSHLSLSLLPLISLYLSSPLSLPPLLFLIIFLLLQLNNWMQFSPAQLLRPLRLLSALFKNTHLFLEPNVKKPAT